MLEEDFLFAISLFGYTVHVPGLQEKSEKHPDHDHEKSARRI